MVADRAAFYDYGRDQRIVNAAWDDVSYKWPSGGYVATAADLGARGRRIVLDSFSLRAMTDGYQRTYSKIPTRSFTTARRRQ